MYASYALLLFLPQYGFGACEGDDLLVLNGTFNFNLDQYVDFTLTYDGIGNFSINLETADGVEIFVVKITPNTVVYGYRAALGVPITSYENEVQFSSQTDSNIDIWYKNTWSTLFMKQPENVFAISSSSWTPKDVAVLTVCQSEVGTINVPTVHLCQLPIPIPEAQNSIQGNMVNRLGP